MTEAELMERVLRRLRKDPGLRIRRNLTGTFRSMNGIHTVQVGFGQGSADLIGWRSIVVTPELVGRRVAVFTALELKGRRTPWQPGQKDFLRQAQEAGCIAGMARTLREAVDLVYCVEQGELK